ncbi:MAG: hypothetical protein ACI9MR_000132 [Myxococcota bacterium]|jgi:hypothetical protein
MGLALDLLRPTDPVVKPDQLVAVEVKHAQTPGAQRIDVGASLTEESSQDPLRAVIGRHKGTRPGIGDSRLVGTAPGTRGDPQPKRSAGCVAGDRRGGQLVV